MGCATQEALTEEIEHIKNQMNDRIHAYIALCSFFVTIILVITSPRVPIMFHFLNWYRDKYGPGSNSHNNSDISRQRDCLDADSVQVVKEEEEPEQEAMDTGETTQGETIQQQSDQIQSSGWKRYLLCIYLDVGVAPVLVLMFLMCTRTLSWSIFCRGIIGNGYLQPYTVILLFMSLAYVCLSLDMTKLFQYLAQQIIARSKDSPKKLFISFSIFTSILTVVTSNDIVILTVTPILCYTAKQTRNLDPIPFVTTQFFLANVWSIALKIGNPTNVIVADAYNLSFLSYFLWMVMPALVAGLSTFGLSYFIFRHKIPDKIELLDEMNGIEIAGGNLISSKTIVLEKKMAIFKSSLLILCLLLLATITNINMVKTWMICLIFGIIFFVIDIITDIVAIIRSVKQSSNWRNEFTSTSWNVLCRMPWKVVPFVFSMFIIVELLVHYSLINQFAQMLCKLLNNIAFTFNNSLTFGQRLESITVIVFSTSVLSFLACNMMNNQPMTIFFTTLFHDSNFQELFQKSDPSIQQGAILSLIIGSNLGANFTLIGALAGLLWITILRNLDSAKGMNGFIFIKYAICVTPVVIIFVNIVLIIELILFG